MVSMSRPGGHTVQSFNRYNISVKIKIKSPELTIPFANFPICPVNIYTSNPHLRCWFYLTNQLQEAYCYYSIPSLYFRNILGNSPQF